MDKIPDVQETLKQPDSATSAESTSTQEASTPPAQPTPDHVADGGNVAAQDAKTSAETSTAGDKDANKKASLLDVVKAAYEAKPDSRSSGEGGKTDAADAATAEGKGSQDDAQASKDGGQKPAEKVPFHNHPRWKEMIAERDALKPKADQFEKITTFMQHNGLSAQEVADGLHVMAMMKTNPQEAYKALQGYVGKLAPLVGEVLPEDLKKDVEEGYVNDERAKELARLRAEREMMAARQAEYQKVQEQQRVQATQKAMHDAVLAWEETEKAKDPDWSAKYEMVMDRVNVLLGTERPSNPSEAIELARRALADVNSRLRPYAGRNVTLRSPTSSLSSANTRPKPSSLEELVRMGLNS